MFKITRNKVELQQGDACQKNWPLIVTVTAEYPGVDPNIFVYHASPDSDTGAMFSNVASMQDMDIIAVDSTTPLPNEDSEENNIPFFRTNKVELNFANVEVLYDRWHTMMTDIRNLVKEYEVMEEQALAEREEITI